MGKINRIITMNLRKLVLSALCALSLIGSSAMAETPGGFLTLNAHLLGGGSYVTNNYKSCYPSINQVNTSMGGAIGVGIGAQLAVARHWSVVTEFNFIRKTTTMDFTATGDEGTGVSNVFQKNKFWTIDVPVYLRWTRTLAPSVAWNVDLGLFYAYGTGGDQNNTIYDVKSNDLGQTIQDVTALNVGYFNDDRGMINTHWRSDIGFHIGTGLVFFRHLTVGVRTHFGLKNVARSNGIVHPNSHNIDVLAVIGWNF